MIDAGKYDKKIIIYRTVNKTDNAGFPIDDEEEIVLRTYASVKTTRGMALITNNSDFEKAYTNFTIRFPKTKITRDMKIKYSNKIYTIEYLNNVNEDNIELEIQAKEVTK